MITNPVIAPAAQETAAVGNLVGNLLALTMIMAGVLVLLYLAWGGIEWLTSGGDKAGLESARARLTNGLIGMVLVISVWAMMSLLSKFLGLSFPKFCIPSLAGDQSCQTGPQPSGPPGPSGTCTAPAGRPNGCSCSTWENCASKVCDYGTCKACSDFNTDPGRCSSHGYGCKYLTNCYFNQGQVCCVPK